MIKIEKNKMKKERGLLVYLFQNLAIVIQYYDSRVFYIYEVLCVGTTSTYIYLITYLYFNIPFHFYIASA